MEEHVHNLKKHRNALYFVVILLLILQTASFVSLSSQVSKLEGNLENTKNTLEKNIEQNKNYYEQQIDLMNVAFKSQINEFSQEVSKSISKQGETLKAEINLLKSSQEDFSGIIEETVKGVVSIGTDKSVGSGFIVNKEGYVVTNFHVIDKGNNVKVQLYDGRILSAQVIGSDSGKDVALLKISGEYYSLKMGNSDNLQVGKKVIAIGNPYGLSFTVTEGIVSAIDRKGPNGLAEYIQTDVSLNPGNSGGPLIDTQGEVIGINNFKVGSAESLGFALEINSAKDTINRLANATIIR